MKPTFIPTENGLKNVSLASSVIHGDGYTLALDGQCNVLCFEKNEGALAMFEMLTQSLQPVKHYSLTFENGGFIDPAIISEVFISPKSGHLLITGTNSKLLYMLKSTAFSNLNDLLEALTAHLMAVSHCKPAEAIQWSSFNLVNP